MNPIPKTVLLVCFLLLLEGGAAPAQGQEPAGDVRRIARVEPGILVPKQVYSLEEQIVIELNLKNPSDVPVTVPAECFGGASFKLHALGDGTLLKGGRLPKQETTVIPPRRERRSEINLTRLYRGLKKPAQYGLWWQCGEWRSPEYVFVLSPGYDASKDRIALVTTDLGTLELVLMPQQAPAHVRNFVELARQGFYDGVVFHEVIAGVQASTGDRKGDGTGGWDHQLGPEIDESIFPGRGLVGATRRESSQTNATQFFILLGAAPGWKGKHTFFAYVRKGQEVLDALSAVPVSATAGAGAFRPIEPIHIRKVEIRGE